MAPHNITLDSDIVKDFFLFQTLEALVPLMESILNQFLGAQATEAVGATKYERSEDRTCYRNGS